VTPSFKKYQRLIQHEAWKYARQWGVDFHELEAQGYLVFVEALTTFNPTKAAFSTHLVSRLRTLGDYAEREHRWGYRRVDELDDDSVFMPESLDFVHAQFRSAFAKSRHKLSIPAQRMLNYLLSGAWSKPGINRKPTLNSVSNAMANAMSQSMIVQAWEELRLWWAEEAQEVLA
jgi:hypothetical protein